MAACSNERKSQLEPPRMRRSMSTSTLDDGRSFITTTTYRGKDMQTLRAGFLNRLGIYEAASGAARRPSQPLSAAQIRRERILRSMGVGYTTVASYPAGSAARSPLGNVVTFQEKLKGGTAGGGGMTTSVSSPLLSLSSSSPTTASISSKSSSPGDFSVSSSADGGGALAAPRTTRIAFHDNVEVLPIPTRHEYSDRIKSRIWSNRCELQENAERNAVEFASEGWNWRTVTEDDGMYICSASGELVHPAWVGDLAAASATASTSVTLCSEEDEAAPSQEELLGGDGPRLERGQAVHGSHP